MVQRSESVGWPDSPVCRPRSEDNGYISIGNILMIKINIHGYSSMVQRPLMV